MSIKVKERLERTGIFVDREERKLIDEEIERITKKKCDEGVNDLSDSEFFSIVSDVKRKKKKEMEVVA